MRHGVAILIPLLLLCLLPAAHGQTQDLNQVLQSRNKDVASVLYQNKSFMSNSAYNGKTAYVSTYNFNNVVPLNSYSSATYTNTTAVNGVYPFATSNANLGSHGFLSSLLKVFGSKSAETKTAFDSHNSFDTRSYPHMRDNAVIQGTYQRRLDKEGAAALTGKNGLGGSDSMHVMTVDEVRALLNKGKP